MATTQLDYARQGIITDKMRSAAAAEGVSPEFIRDGIAAGEFQRDVALCMAWRIDNMQTRNDLIARFDHFHLVLDCRVVAPCTGDQTRALGR